MISSRYPRPAGILETLSQRETQTKRRLMLHWVACILLYFPIALGLVSLVGLYFPDIAVLKVPLFFLAALSLPNLIIYPLVRFAYHRPPADRSPVEAETFKETFFSIQEQDLPFNFQCHENVLLFDSGKEYTGRGESVNVKIHEATTKHVLIVDSEKREVFYKAIVSGKYSSSEPGKVGTGRFWNIGFDWTGYEMSRNPSMYFDGENFIAKCAIKNTYEEVVLYPLIEMTLHYGWTWRSSPFLWLR